MKLRHQLAAFSPIRAGAIVTGAVAAAGLAGDPRARLSAILVDRFSATSCELCGSGTQALQRAITMMASDTRDGFIAMPAFNCYDMASAAIGAGVRVALYDIDPLTLGPDLSSFERVLAAGAAVAVVAPLYGVPIDWNGVSAIAAQFGIPLIEDAAQGHGAAWNGVPLGSLGDVSTLSFGRGKGWTGGNGGAVLGRIGGASEATGVATSGLATEVKVGLGLLAQWTLGRPAIYGLPRSVPALALGETVYQSPRAPADITRGAAASVIANARAADAEAVERRRNGNAFLTRVARSRAHTIDVPTGGVAGYIRFPIRIAGGLGALPGANRAAELGIAASYPQTLATLAPFQGSLVPIERRWPGADSLVVELITLPTHSLVSTHEREAIVRAVRSV
ncbi:MAG: DegT/DnrJ/EryC1/StrS family aminotransferase [Gemmatimonadota bacterium]